MVTPLAAVWDTSGQRDRDDSGGTEVTAVSVMTQVVVGTVRERVTAVSVVRQVVVVAVRDRGNSDVSGDTSGDSSECGTEVTAVSVVT